MTHVNYHFTLSAVIRTFRHRGLKELFESGRSRRIAPALQARILRRLVVIDRATALAQMNVPGFNFHSLRGQPPRHSIHVNGPWCLTFAWDGENALDLDLEQYH